MKECFYCDKKYELYESTAPEPYKATYCSAECMKVSEAILIEEAAKFLDGEIEKQEKAKKEAEEGIKTVNIGGFILKVKKDN